jgi:hypothetical protein
MDQIHTVTDGSIGAHQGTSRSARLIVRHTEVLRRKLEVIGVFLEEFNCIVDPDLHEAIWKIAPCTMMDRDDWDWHSYCNNCRAGMPCEVAVRMVEEEERAAKNIADSYLPFQPEVIEGSHRADS